MYAPACPRPIRRKAREAPAAEAAEAEAPPVEEEAAEGVLTPAAAEDFRSELTCGKLEQEVVSEAVW